MLITPIISRDDMIFLSSIVAAAAGGLRDHLHMLVEHVC